MASNSFETGETVCVKANSSFAEPLSIYWVNPDGAVVQVDPITSTNPEGSRQVNARGNWKAYLVSRADGSAKYVIFFTVSDPLEPVVDLAVFKGSTTGTATAGGVISYSITVKNYGPDTAGTVELTDPVPANAAYLESSQDSGPLFTRDAETPTTTWSIASLPAGESATFTFTYTVTGAAGSTINNTVNVSSATEEQYPNDNTWTTSDTISSGGGDPTCSLDCPNDIVTAATTSGAGGGANVTYAAPEAFGSCGTVTSSPASGSFFPIGTTTVNSSSATGGGFCSFTVTVIDSPAPTISCPANIGPVAANEGEGQAYVPDPSQSSSNVGTPTTTGENLVVTGSREDGEALTGPYPIGSTTITWTATEYSTDPETDPEAQPTGRSANCEQTITVTGGTTLTITCPADQTVESPNDCDPATVNPGTATSNSGSATITSERSDSLGLNDPYPAGVTTITWTATGADNQSASCTQTITVTTNDTTPPTLTVPPDVSATTSSCTATLDDELGVATAEEDCGTVSISRSGVPTFSCPTPQEPNRQCESFVFPTGTTIITYTATNSAGLTATGTQQVTVTEDPPVPPTITAPADASYQCASEVPAASPSQATAADNCGTPTVTVSQTDNGGAGSPASPLVITRTYTATDASGNSASDSQTITVIDNTPPTVTAPADSSASADASCQAPVPNYVAGSIASDNCDSSVTVTQSPAAGTMVGKGQHTVTVTATDDAGNSSSDQVVFTVTDDTPPTISCQASVIVDFDPAVNGAVVTYTTPVGSDNCAGATTTQTAGLSSGSTFPLGTTTNTFTVTDGAGHTASCSFTVTVALTSIIGLDSVTITGSAYVDSYNSAGGYPATKSSQANVLSNGTVTMGNSAKVWGNVRSTRAGINMTGSSHITGNATAGTTVSTSGSASVGGTRTNNAMGPVMTLPPVAACGPPYSPDSGISGTYTYNASTGNLTLSGTNIATLANGTYCFNNVTLGNVAQLKVNGPVVIKLTGTLNTSGATNVNNTTLIPSNLRILSSRSGGGNGIILGNSASTYAVVYAPNTGVNISGSAPLFGTAAGKTIVIGNSGAIHYDIALKEIWPELWALIVGP